MEPTEEYPISTDDEFDLEKFDNIINTRPFPWIKVVIKIFNSVNLTCDHQIKCVSSCYEKQRKSCQNLINALLGVYQSSSGDSRSSSIQTNLRFNDIAAASKQRVNLVVVIFYSIFPNLFL